MKFRAAVSLTLAAAVGLGLTGCNYISPQRTATKYAASDGANADFGQVKLRNGLLVVEGVTEHTQAPEKAHESKHEAEHGADHAHADATHSAETTTTPTSVARKRAHLTGSLITEKPLSGAVKVELEGSGSAKSVPLAANATATPLSHSGADDVVLEGDFMPGSTVTVTFTDPSGASAKVQIPVLDGSLPEYRTLMPTPAANPANTNGATESPTATPGASTTPSASPSATPTSRAL